MGVGKNPTTVKTQNRVEETAPGFFRRRQAANYIGVSLATLDAWIKKKLVPTIRPSKRVVLLKRSDLEQALARFAVTGVAQ